MIKFFVVMFLLLITFKLTNAQSRYLSYSESEMKQSKEAIKNNDPIAREAYRNIIRLADSIMKSSYFTRVTNKKLTAVSGDIHDYVSMATYYWPVKDSNGKVKYTPRDGKANPEITKINNASNLARMSESVNLLGLAYYYTNDEKYVKKGLALLRAFFLNADTKMNPNMEHAQFISGQNFGRIEGIIDSRFFVRAIEGILLMKDSPNFSKKDYSGLKNWFSEFLSWMEESKMGKKGMTLTNNIGTAYQMQRIAYHRFIGNLSSIKQIVDNDLNVLIKKQFDTHGKQVLELKRTLPFNYSVANLEYWATIQNMCSNAGISFKPLYGEKLSNATVFLDSKNFGNVNRRAFPNYVKVDQAFSNRSSKKMSSIYNTKTVVKSKLSINEIENLLSLNK